MRTKRAYVSLAPLDRERLLNEAMSRARARAERPERLAANARHLTELRARLGPPADQVDKYVQPATRMSTAERTRNAAMDTWRRDHEAQLAKRD